MQLLAILGVLLLSLFIFLGAAGQSRKPAPAKPTPPPAKTTTVETVKSMSRAELESMLRKVETSEAPKPKMGAMCYKVAAPPNRAEYVCPVCGERTLYAIDPKKADSPNDAVSADRAQVKTLGWELPACRREMEALKKNSKLKLSLDESSFCKKCQPKAKERGLKLTVTYDDGKKHTVSPVGYYDILLLRDFLKGQLSCEAERQASYPIRKKMARLRELLGLTPPKKPEIEPKPIKNK